MQDESPKFYIHHSYISVFKLNQIQFWNMSNIGESWKQYIMFGSIIDEEGMSKTLIKNRTSTYAETICVRNWQKAVM